MILYIANPLKLPFFRYCNKNLITTMPTRKLANTPTKNGMLNTKSLNFSTVAARTIGADNMKEYLAADSLSMPMALAVVMVIPDLDTPGIKARHWDSPIKKVCLNVMCSYVVLFFPFLSTMYKIIPITIRAIAMMSGFSSAFPANLSNISPIMPPGIVAMTIYQNIFPSKLFFFFTTCSKPPLISCIQSLKKKMPMASSVPKCSATSNPSKAKLNASDCVHPSNHGMMAKWAELDIGNNSVNPCTMPSISA